MLFNKEKAMHWNYRMIDLSHENGDEPWIEICEVFYNDDGSLMGYTPANLGSETVADLKKVAKRMAMALSKPVLKDADFGNAPNQEETK